MMGNTKASHLGAEATCPCTTGGWLQSTPIIRGTSTWMVRCHPSTICSWVPLWNRTTLRTPPTCNSLAPHRKMVPPRTCATPHNVIGLHRHINSTCTKHTFHAHGHTYHTRAAPTWAAKCTNHRLWAHTTLFASVPTFCRLRTPGRLSSLPLQYKLNVPPRVQGPLRKHGSHSARL